VCLVTLAGVFSTPTGLHGQELIRASKAGRVERVEALLASDPGRVDPRDENGYTPLRWAAIRGQTEVAILLLESGADPNTVGADGGTPLHGAAHHDDGRLMEALLSSGGDVTIQNRWGRSPLHVAARRGCLEVARILLDFGADPNAVTNEGWSTLSVAYRGGHPALAELLLERGADPALADGEGRLPGEVTLTRPEPVRLSRRILDEYVGLFVMGGQGGFRVWRIGDEMHLMEFAPDRMTPVALDTFVTVQEPWRVVFDRDPEGEVSGMEVEFLRRSVWAEKVFDTSSGFTYVGSASCRACHSSAEADGPFDHWARGRHREAWVSLTSEEARALAASREEYRDMTDPSLDQRCLMCHVTASQNPDARWEPGVNGRDEGVGCEACHGPGSAYATLENMSDPEAFLANGGRIPDVLTCRECHRDERFDHRERRERIRHWKD
jgi:hypothetical protein